MRKILVDARPLQTPAYRARGIGVHLRQWLANAIPLQAQFQLTLLVESQAMPLPPELRLYPRLAVGASMSSGVPNPAYQAGEDLRFSAALDEVIYANGFDLYHNSYPLAAEYHVSPRVTACPTIASLYDTILLRFPSEYLSELTRRQKLAFLERCEAITGAVRVQTLTHSSACDIIQDLGVPARRIDVVSCGVDESFMPLPDHGRERLRAYGLTPGYVLAVSGGHHSKNLAGALRAYALLDHSLRAQHPLVVLATIDPEAAGRFDELARQSGIAGEVRRLQNLSAPDMVALYNGATLLVHASLWEGFGLPVIEAMRCGTPVACSNTSSLPEAGSDAAVYFDPAQPADIARITRLVLTNPQQREAMRERGARHAASFTWASVARRVFESYEQALRATTPRRRKVLSRPIRRRIAYWSPLPPVPSGISDYSESLLDRLGRHVDVDIFVDGYAPDNRAWRERLRVFDGRAFATQHALTPYDANLFQLGNSPHHTYMRDALLRSPCPAIGVFHDGSMYHFYADGLSERALIAEINAEAGWRHAWRAWRRGRHGRQNPNDYTALRTLACACAGIITHSAFVAQRCRAAAPAAPLEIIPFGIEYYADDGGRGQAIAREALTLPHDAVIFGAFGHMHPVKRIQQALDAFLAVAREMPVGRIYLYLQGTISAASPQMLRDLARDRTRARAMGVIIQDGYPPYENMLLGMQAIDVGLNLRFPTSGETSATLCGLLGMGKPVVISDCGAFSELPDDCVIKIGVDDQEPIALTRVMLQLVEDASLRTRMAQAARCFAQPKSWPATAQRYWSFIEQILSSRT